VLARARLQQGGKAGGAPSTTAPVPAGSVSTEPAGATPAPVISAPGASPASAPGSPVPAPPLPPAAAAVPADAAAAQPPSADAAAAQPPSADASAVQPPGAQPAGAQPSAQPPAALDGAVPETNRAPSEAPAAPRPDSSEQLPLGPRAEVEHLLGQNRLNDAERVLVRARRAHPDAAWIHQELAEIYFRRLWRRDAIKEWDEALRLEPALRRQRVLQQELCAALDPHWNGETERLLEARLGATAAGLMRDCIRTTKNRDVLHAAARVTEQVARSRLDRGLVATRELELAASCEDRRTAVQRIAELGDRRAIDVLVKLERARVDRSGRPLPQHACLGTSVREALARLR